MSLTGKKVSLESLLKGLVKHKASDLHLKAGRPPIYRINGDLIPTKLPRMSNEQIKDLAYGMMNSKMQVQLERDMQIDFGYTVQGLSRFRANVFIQRGTISLVIRIVPLGVPSIDKLSLPPVVKELFLKDRGLILVTGATGSGKSTTLAAALEYINQNRRCHIVTIEDPIEFMFQDKLSSVSQREIGTDALEYQSALKAALRQDPDVIMVGEMRDHDTIQTAISASETGHLVMSTLHTNTAAKSVDRIIDSFPGESKNQVRLQLATTLLAVISQRLIPKIDGDGLACACEVLVKSPSVERLIIENKIDEIENAIETSGTYYKMQTMNQSISDLVKRGVISMEEAVRYSDKPEDLRLKMSGMLGGGQRDADATSFIEQTQMFGAEVDEDAYEEETDTGLELDVDTGFHRKRRA